MDLFLQVWAAGFYLLNKLLFAMAEKTEANMKKVLKMGAWVAFLVGVPAWLVVLAGEGNWIATSVEAGGIPAMFLGLYNTYHDDKKDNKIFNNIVLFSTYSALILGIGYSMILYNGITAISQVLEMGIMFGFLIGSYFMARNNPKGWLFFMLMNASTVILMFLQEKPILMAQQLLSLFLVVYGYYLTKKNANDVSS